MSRPQFSSRTTLVGAWPTEIHNRGFDARPSRVHGLPNLYSYMLIIEKGPI